MLAREDISAVLAERIPVQAPAGIPPAMVTEYVHRCLTAVPVLHVALDRSDYEHMRIFGHRLKGSGGAYGIPALTEIGCAIEAAAIGNDRAELQRQVAALEECLSRIEVLCR
jgi:HPt (histidine-containing phosphotransfer) domain-containing protein